MCLRIPPIQLLDALSAGPKDADALKNLSVFYGLLLASPGLGSDADTISQEELRDRLPAVHEI